MMYIHNLVLLAAKCTWLLPINHETEENLSTQKLNYLWPSEQMIRTICTYSIILTIMIQRPMISARLTGPTRITYSLFKWKVRLLPWALVIDQRASTRLAQHMFGSTIKMPVIATSPV